MRALCVSSGYAGALASNCARAVLPGCECPSTLQISQWSVCMGAQANGRRAFGTTDGPFRHIKPKFVERKKHYNELLIMGDRRKLLETAQDVLHEPQKQFPTAFWEVLAKRCIQSIHLFEPLELAIIVRAFDAHDVKLRGDLDIYGQVARCVPGGHGHSGLAVIILADVLSRRLPTHKMDLLKDVLKFLGRRAADVMWELSTPHAIRFLEVLTSQRIRDPALCSRVARKVLVQLSGANTSLELEDLCRAATAFAGQGHRDLGLCYGIAERVAFLSAGSPEGALVAQQVLKSFTFLRIDKVPESLHRAAAA